MPLNKKGYLILIQGFNYYDLHRVEERGCCSRIESGASQHWTLSDFGRPHFQRSKESLILLLEYLSFFLKQVLFRGLGSEREKH